MSELTSNKKARLGRGIGSLLGGNDFSDSAPAATTQPASQQPSAIKSAAASANIAPPSTTNAQAAAPIDETQKIWSIGIERIVPNTRQPRKVFNADDLKDLSASIKEKGILQPIVARRTPDGKIEIIAGERRWRAAQTAGLREVPVILKKIHDQDSFEFAIIENIQRADLNPMEEADAYDRLMRDFNLTQQQVADKVGKERATVANALRLLALPAELKAMVSGGTLSSGHAKVLLSLESTAEQVRLAKIVAEEKLSVRATERLVAKTKSSPVGATAGHSKLNVDVSKRLIDGLSTELQKLMGTKVAIDYSNSKGKISISFYSDEELSQTVEKLRNAWRR